MVKIISEGILMSNFSNGWLHVSEVGRKKKKRLCRLMLNKDGKIFVEYFIIIDVADY